MSERQVLLGDWSYDAYANWRINLVRFGRSMDGFDMAPREFFEWCRSRRIRLRTLCSLLYRPYFPSEEAREEYRLKWLTTGNP